MEKVKEQKRILINPPPSDYRCEICGRAFKEFNKKDLH